MANQLQRYSLRQWTFREQLVQSSHCALARVPPEHPFVLFFGGSNLFVPFSMDRQLQAILELGDCPELVLNVGKFGLCDSGYVLETTAALLRGWSRRRPALLIYEISPNEMPPAGEEFLRFFNRRQLLHQLILEYDEGRRLTSSLRRRPMELGDNLERLARLTRGGRQRTIPILALDFESNVLHWAPSISAFSRPLSADRAKRAREALRSAMADFRKGSFDSAAARLADCAAIDSEIALLRYLQGRLAERAGRLAEAWEHLEAARAADLVRGRFISGVLARDLAERCGELGISFLSVPDLIRSLTGGRPPGFDIFMEWVHYRPEIHHRIALALAERAVADGLFGLEREPRALLPQPVGRDQHWEFVLYHTALDMLQMPPSPFSDERIARARGYVEEASTLVHDPELAGQMARRLELLIRRCFEGEHDPPSTATTGPDASVEEVICSLLEQRLGVRVEDHELETDLRLLGVDSLSLLEILQALFVALEKPVPTHELVLDNVITVGKMAQLVRRPPEPSTAGQIQRQQSLEQHRLRSLRRGLPTPRPSRSSRPEVPADATLPALLERHFNTRAEEHIMSFLPAGRHDAKLRMTWGDLERASLAAATGLTHFGVKPGQIVLIMTGHDPMTIYAFVGCLRIGAIPSILDTPSAKMSAEIFLETFGQIARASAASLALVGPAERGFVEQGLRAAGLAETLRVVDIPDLAHAPAGPVPPVVENPELVALLQHSSGTTGTKKGVALSHRAILAQIGHYAKALDLRADDRIVSWLPLYHDMGLIACLVMPLVTATPVWMMSPFDWLLSPDLMLAAVTKERSTLAWMPNFAFHYMADRVRVEEHVFDLCSLRAVVNCSEPIDARAWQHFYSRFAASGLSRFAGAASYAMAENVFAVTQGGIDGPGHIDYVRSDRLRRDGCAVAVCDQAVETTALPSCGRAIDGTEIAIIDEHGRPLPERTVGEIRIRGDSLARGYHRSPRATARAFTSEGFLTGDLGYLSDDQLYVVGRSKDLIIVAGQNIYPHDLEAAVGRIPGLRPGRVAAFGLDMAETGTQRLVVIAEIAAEMPVTATDCRRLRRAVRQALYDLVHVGVPGVVLVPRDSLRKSSSGKMSRQMIRDLYLLGILRPLKPTASVDA